MIRPCTFESYTARGWSPILADLAAAWYETNDPALLKRLVPMLKGSNG